MLKLRAISRDVLRGGQVEGFVARISTFLRQECPQEVRFMTERALRDSIKQGIKNATVHGIETETGIVIHILLRLTWPDDFYADPEAARLESMLCDPRLSEEQRIDRFLRER